MKKYFITLLLLFFLSACVGSSTSGVFGSGVSIALDPRTLGTQIDDSIIDKSIDARLLVINKNYFITVSTQVLDGRIFITGKVDNPEEKLKITKLAWETKGARSVKNDLKIKENSINSRIVFIFIGWSSFSDSLLNQIMRIGYYQCKTSIYIVVDNDIKSYENKINNSYPGLCDSNYAKEIISINYINSHALNNLSLGAKDTVSAVVCGNNPDKIFLQAIDITSNKITNLRYIFVEIPDGSGYNKVINAINNEQKNYSMVTVGSHSKAFELSEKMDKYAKLSHQKYLKEREDNGLRVQKFDGSYENSGDEDWENLDDTCRNWNRSPLDHSEIKLRVLANINNLPMHSRDSDTGDIFIHNSLKHKAISLIHHFKTKNTLNEDIELLSKLEHNRWSGEKFSEGWVFGKETNKSQKISSFLIPYEDLSDSIKQYDREQVIQQLENLIVIN